MGAYLKILQRMQLFPPVESDRQFRPRVSKSPEYKLKLLNKFADSDLNLMAWCREEGINYNKMNSYKIQLMKLSLGNQIELIRKINAK